ncbi:transposase family protein [Streptomyces sp. NPDC015232]|uniref:transposase family protein n=1 Tax=unclassified Streptomyces TaxID=2593676 RepID=UPI0036FF1747
MHVDAKCTTTGAACPECGASSTRVHSSSLRFPADVPSAGRRVVLQLHVRRFRCGTTSCRRRTFVEQISGLPRRHGQLTERLRSTLAALGLALAGRAGTRLAHVPRMGGAEELGRRRACCQDSVGMLLVRGAGQAADVEGRAVCGDRRPADVQRPRSSRPVQTPVAFRRPGPESKRRPRPADRSGSRS